MSTDKPAIENKVPLLNRATKVFLLRLVALVAVWESLYYFVLKPIRIPDRALTNFLTVFVTAGINFFTPGSSDLTWVENTRLPITHLMENGKTVFLIADICNGLDLYMIFLGLIWLLPSPVKRKLIFSLAGIAAIFVANVIRCISLYWIYKNHPSMFEFNHHYLFTILMYLLIFYGWVLFTKKAIYDKVN